eukprot:CAMPEP_0116930052 /NCGR_PEP_ID=MMETSP0467-20121206/26960_1 /TAXON_ID=283647 /ORGANISM="Mesodinium pulex, Strain SPMC105" /LENGTH=60 /DNA_ID=CAMNT_0004610165 /DNA_START=833 /DNA_END=1015 /DNA_ORIENTATION=+
MRNTRSIEEIIYVFCNFNIIEDQTRDLITPNYNYGTEGGSKRYLTDHFNLDEINGIDLFP